MRRKRYVTVGKYHRQDLDRDTRSWADREYDTPEIRLRGKWLGEAGFQSGFGVVITVEGDGRLLLSTNDPDLDAMPARIEDRNAKVA